MLMPEDSCVAMFPEANRGISPRFDDLVRIMDGLIFFFNLGRSQPRSDELGSSSKTKFKVLTVHCSANHLLRIKDGRTTLNSSHRSSCKLRSTPEAMHRHKGCSSCKSLQAVTDFLSFFLSKTSS
jgi:hypothetical protein